MNNVEAALPRCFSCGADLTPEQGIFYCYECAETWKGVRKAADRVKTHPCPRCEYLRAENDRLRDRLNEPGWLTSSLYGAYVGAWGILGWIAGKVVGDRE